VGEVPPQAAVGGARKPSITPSPLFHRPPVAIAS
jgi:hypothetical protein